MDNGDTAPSQGRLYSYDKAADRRRRPRFPPTFEKFCCGLSLETGVKIVAFYQTVIQLVLFGLKIKPMYDAFSSTPTTPTVMNIVESVSCCIIYSIEFVMALVLIIGISKGMMGNLKFWLRVECVIEACHIFEVTALLVALCLQYQATGLFEEALDVVVDIFCLLVVYSYYVDKIDPLPPSAKLPPDLTYKSQLNPKT